MKIYVASSWRNGRQNEVVNILREAGHEVYDFKNPSETDKGFDWADIDPNWKDWTTTQYTQALQHPIAVKGFMNDFAAMNWAEVCVLVLPCGRSANTEAGYMAGKRKPVIVLQESKEEPELMYKIYDSVVDSVDFVLKRLDELGIRKLELMDICFNDTQIASLFVNENMSRLTYDAFEFLKKQGVKQDEIIRHTSEIFSSMEVSILNINKKQ